MDKIIAIAKSVRFQQLLVAFIVLGLSYYEVIPQELANLIASFFGVSVTIGTIDKAFTTTK